MRATTNARMVEISTLWQYCEKKDVWLSFCWCKCNSSRRPCQRTGTNGQDSKQEPKSVDDSVRYINCVYRSLFIILVYWRSFPIIYVSFSSSIKAINGSRLPRAVSHRDCNIDSVEWSSKSEYGRLMSRSWNCGGQECGRNMKATNLLRLKWVLIEFYVNGKSGMWIDNGRCSSYPIAVHRKNPGKQPSAARDGPPLGFEVMCHESQAFTTTMQAFKPGQTIQRIYACGGHTICFQLKLQPRVASLHVA